MIIQKVRLKPLLVKLDIVLIGKKKGYLFMPVANVLDVRQ